MVIYVIRHVLKIDKACLPLTPPVPLCLPQSEGGKKGERRPPALGRGVSGELFP